MTMGRTGGGVFWAGGVLVLACAYATRVPATAAETIREPVSRATVLPAVVPGTQLLVVTTPAWDSTHGTLRRYERDSTRGPWRAVGATVHVVVGATGLAWAAGGAAHDPGDPVKREGDGKSPAGVFAVDTAFGFAPAVDAGWIRLPYAPITESTECVDDTASVHYNTVVDRGVIQRVDWRSAEHMRGIEQYRIGAIVAYNSNPPRAGRGSCIFLHIWGGADSPTSGCTAMPEHDLTELLLWLDRRRQPVLAQLPSAEYARLREGWGLP